MRAFGFHLPRDFFIAEIEDGHERRRAELFARHHDGFQAVGFAERAEEAGIGRARLAKRCHLEKMMVQEKMEAIDRMARTAIPSGGVPATISQTFT